jgi:hypothetical protein
MKKLGLMKSVLFLTAILFVPPLCAEQYPIPEKIIQNEVQFIFSDGSSYYRFVKDGSFLSGPMGESGRTINGTWKTNLGSSSFVVTGKLGWLNGITESEAVTIKMVMVIYPPQDEEKEIKAFWAAHATQPIRVYKPYFFIQQLNALSGAKR